jgi:hypothetical protein
VCKENDYLGHTGTKHSEFPHFHFAMHLDNKPFIKFNDFHIPFTDEDLFNIKCIKDNDLHIDQSFDPYGAGMSDATSMPLETVLQESLVTEDPENATYHIQSLISTDDGSELDMDLILEAINKSKESGKPVANFLKDLQYNRQIIVSPADSIPDKEVRSKTR